jgi:4-aminobutyrate aminotransferase-like enzyme/Ser/Thr protein kinase RdoA (MazF antagonist)
MSFSENRAIELVKNYYGKNVKAKSLSGEYDFNFLLEDEKQQKFILKIANDQHSYDFYDAQAKMVAHLSSSEISDKFSRYIPSVDGKAITILQEAGRPYYMRLLSYLEGEFWMNLPEKSDRLNFDLGNFLGKMDKQLKNFSHPAMHRHYVWDISNAMDANRKLHHIKDHEKRRMVNYFLLQFETEVLPHISSLRHAYAHHDANDTNILVKGDSISGLIDFGDMVYTALINNLAVACTYAMMNQEDPLQVMASIVRGYHQAYPLLEQEIDLLYWLVAARLCISLTQSAYNAAIATNNEHHFISVKPAWELLYRMIRINPLAFQDEARRACGFNPIIDNTDYSALLKDRKEYIGRNLSISYEQKLKIVRGAFQYLYDDKGRTYIDCVNNPSHVGHCHPVVVRKMQRQLATLNTNTRYLNDNMMAYAKKLTATLPPSLKVCYFTNSGSEANDLAVRIARHCTKSKDIIVLDHAYHGTSTVAMEMSPYKFDNKAGFGKMPWIHKAMNPDMYRGPYKYGDAEAGKKYAADVKRIIEELKQEGKSPAVFICETLLGVGGQIPLPPNYLKEVYKHVREAGGICIADEVQVGFGRVGDKFWGFELQEVVPDIVVMGKPIGNGHPLAAVVVTDAIADAFNNGLEYFNTYGGNPVSMATGLAVLEVIQDEEMQQHAKETGEHLMNGLRELMKKYPLISDVRGHGLFIGAEMVADRQTLEPAVKQIDQLVELMKEKGFLLSTDGPLHNVLKIKPPMPFNKENADEMLKCLNESLVNLH